MGNRSTERINSGPAGIARAGALIAGGGIVAFPTETVYGLGADARNGEAVARIYEAKGRPAFNPLIVHLSDPNEADRIVQITPLAERLMDAFWPGPMSLVLTLHRDHGLSSLVTAGLKTVALRLPDAEAARAIITASGGPVAAPSANRSGSLSPTTADHVLAGLSGRIDAIYDGGPCRVGVESTILDASGPQPRVLRLGGLPLEALKEEVDEALSIIDGKITAPGQLASHYAPRAPLRLNADRPDPGEVFLGFGTTPGDETLSAGGDLREAAANLFESLHRLDATGQPIAVAPIPDRGLGRAINDRLSRAAAPRDHSE